MKNNTFFKFKIDKKKLLTFFLLFLSIDIFSHVKWFSGFNFLNKSKSTIEVVDLTYIILFILSLIIVSLLIFLDNKFKKFTWNKKLGFWLDSRRNYGYKIIVIATFIVLFISWVNNTILTPELRADNEILPWIQFFVALLLLIPSTTNISGILLIGIYFYCIYKFGFFYMLDYAHFIGIGLYLFTKKSKNQKISKIAIPSLYIALGFSLIWLGFEKLYYPFWSRVIIEQNLEITFGLPMDFFIKSAAFIEIGLGFVMLFGATQRFLAAIITVIFILTSLIFGKIEIIGHTSLHAMLIVFILSGTKKIYKPPINRLKKMSHRLFVGNMSYIVVSLFFLFAYKMVSDNEYKLALINAKKNNMNSHNLRMVDVSKSKKKPKIIYAEIFKEPMDMGYNLKVKIDNWKFTPDQIGNSFKENQGHVHVYINGKKHGRMYCNWYYLGKLSKGMNKISLTINADDHSAFTINNKMIGIEKEIIVD